MFADDTTSYYIGKEFEEIIDALNLVLKVFRVCFCRNHLTVRTGNTVATLISSHAIVGPLIRLLKFGNSYIHLSTKCTCLGVEMTINWSGKPKFNSCTLSLEHS